MKTEHYAKRLSHRKIPDVTASFSFLYLLFFHIKACHCMSGSNLFQLRHLCLTSVCAILAAVLERAALWVHPEDLVPSLSTTLDLLAGIHMNGELCTQKCLCIWMHCILCNIFTWNNLYDISQIHNSNLMGKRTDQRQVMADESMLIFFLSEGVPEARSQTPTQKHPAQKSPHRKPGSPVPVKALLQY